MRLILFCLCLLFYFSNIEAQEKKMTIHLENANLSDLIYRIESNFNVRFSYNDANVSDKKISISFQDKSLNEIIDLLNQKTPLFFDRLSDRNIIVEKRISKNESKVSKTTVLKEILLVKHLNSDSYLNINGGYKLSLKEINNIPGLIEPDILQSIQILPGSISPDESASHIHVRGGTPDQNLILWNGIKIYQPDHLFGAFSAFNYEITKEVNFVNKGTDAQYGDRISSTISIDTNNDVHKDFTGGFGVNLLDVNGYFILPVIKDKINIEISGRRSFTDVFKTSTYNKYTEKIFQDQNTDLIFRGKENFYYSDYSVKSNGEINKRNRFYVSFISIQNELKTDFPIKDDTSFKDELETKNSGFSFDWNSKISPSLLFHVQAYISNYELDLNHTEIAENEEGNSWFKNYNKVNDAGVLFNLGQKLNDVSYIDYGYNYINYKVLSKLDKDVVGNVFYESQNTLSNHALYASYKFSKEKNFNITGGIRFIYYPGIRDFELEPRFNLVKKVNNNIDLHITAERKTQAISQIEKAVNSNLVLENKIWVLANQNQIPLSAGWQFTAGINYSKNNWHVNFETYFKRIEGLSTLHNDFIDIGDINIESGEGKVFGSDFYAKKQINNFNTSISYTFNKSLNNFEGLNEARDFPSNTDIRHNFYWMNGFNFKKFNFSLGWRWHSGKPYSKANTVEADTDGRNKLIYDGINGYRLPNYSRVDFTTTYTFNFNNRNSINARLGFSILNIFNKSNILSRSYRINDSGDDFYSIDMISLKRVFNFVFKIKW